MKRKSFIICVMICIIMLMFTGCHTATDVEFNTNGEGTYTTVNYLDKQMSDSLPEMEEIIKENIPEGVNASVSTRVEGGKPLIETSINYNSLEDFNIQVSKLNDVVEYGYKYEENRKRFSKIVNSQVTKAVNIFLEEETFSYALKEYFKNNGINIEDNSNMYRKFLKLIMSVVKIDETMIDEFSNNYTDELITENNFIEDNFYYDNEYDNWIDDDIESDVDGPTIEKDGYTFFQEINNERVLRIHIDSLVAINEFILYVVQMNMSDEISENMYIMNDPIDEERVMLYNKVFTEIELAEKVKSAIEGIKLEKNDYSMDDLKPNHVIDIFTDDYITMFNETLNKYVCEDVEDNVDSLFDLFYEEEYEEDIYKLSFGKDVLELDEFDLYEYCDEFMYLTLYENGSNNDDLEHKTKNNINTDRLDDTPNTADNIPIIYIIMIVIIASVLTLYFYRKRKYC